MENPSQFNVQRGFRPKTHLATIFFYLLIAALAIFIYLNFTEFKSVVLYLKNIRPLWFGAAVIVQISTYAFVAAIFIYLIKRFGIKRTISYADLFKAAIASFTLTNLIPSGGVSGQGYLIYFFQRKNFPKNESFLLAVLETLSYYFAHFVFAIFLLCYLFFSHAKLSGVLFTIGFIGAAFFLVLDVLVLSLTSKKIMVFMQKWSQRNRLVRFIWKRLHIVEEQFAHREWESPFEFIKNERGYLLVPLLYQAIILLADAFTIWLLFDGFSYSVNFFVILAGFVLTRIVAMISFSPGGLVFFEGAMVLFYSAFSIPAQLVLIITLMFRFLSFWLPLPIGLIFYKQLGGNAMISEENNPADKEK